MALYKDKGIVIKQRDFSEADRIVSIITQYNGRVEAIAKGIRKPSSRKGGNVSLIAHSSFSFAKGRNLDIITEAELIEGYDELKADLKNIGNIFYILEVTEKLTPEGDNTKDIYYLLISLLNLLKSKQDYNTALISYIIHILYITGHGPHLSTCASCSDTLVENDEKYAGINEIGIFDNCIRKSTINSNGFSSKYTKISNKYIKSLRFIRENTLSDSLKLNVTEKEQEDLKQFINNWIQVIIGREIKANNFLM